MIERPDANSGTGWRLRWRDPNTGKVRKVTLDPERYPDDGSRADAATRKSLEIRTARLDAREGIVSMPIADAVKRYLASNRKRLRTRTMADYEKFGDVFAGWCEAQRIAFARDLTQAKLEAFRSDRVTMLRERGDSDEIRAPGTVNVELAAIHTMIKAWRRLGWTPDLDTDAIADALRKEKVPRDEVRFLRPAQCQALLRRAMAHDAETYKLTRDKRQDTRKYTPIAPFVAVLVCTGMRFNEALGLRWSEVTAAEITLSAARTKTKQSRHFDLDLAPRCRDVLDALRLQSVRANPQGDLVFPDLTRDMLEAARKRMRKLERNSFSLLAPPIQDPIGPWSWQTLRRTAATALACMPNVGPWQESQLLGHGVAVAESRYARRMKLPPDANTIEKALGIEREMILLCGVVLGPALKPAE